jgi:hypothetical protein
LTAAGQANILVNPGFETGDMAPRAGRGLRRQYDLVLDDAPELGQRSIGGRSIL